MKNKTLITISVLGVAAVIGALIGRIIYLNNKVCIDNIDEDLFGDDVLFEDDSIFSC